MSEREVFSEMEMHYEERRKRVMKQHKNKHTILGKGKRKNETQQNDLPRHRLHGLES